MAFRTLIILGILFLLHSCAQVGSLTGGPEDTTAPKPIVEKMNPQNGATNFRTSVVKIPFSEFIKLENPTETIVMVPPHAKPSAKVVKKTVYISWDDTLKDNTTYTIYLNGTIKDYTAGNDSLMQIVFTTGDFLDSLSYQVKVIDAFSSEPIKSCLVGLYEGATDSIKPTYFVKTSDKGIAKFTNLKEGKYTVLAFEDKNKDMYLQADEKLAFNKDLIDLSTTYLDSNSCLKDSIPLRLFQQKQEGRIRSFSFKPPSLYTVGANSSLKEAQLTVNGENLTKENFNFITEDSLSFLYSIGDSSSVQLIAKTTSFIDTTSIRLTKREKEGKLTFSTNLIDNSLYPQDTLTFLFTDQISTVDTSLFILKNKADSSLIRINKLKIANNKLLIPFNKEKYKSVDLLVLPNAIVTKSTSLKDSIKLLIPLKESRDFGSIKLDISEYSQPIVLEVLAAGKVVRSLQLENQKEILLEQLVPSDYSFRIVVDENKNGKWDTGDREKSIFPEILLTFSEITKVRANWEVEVKLIKK
jgi:hypothetical protein